jgi:hypothetical protein
MALRVGHDARCSVKTDCPGGRAFEPVRRRKPEPGPVSLPETIRRRASTAVRSTGCSPTIEPYLNMAKGDAITLRWGDVRLDLPKIQAKGVGQPCRSGCRRR